MKQNKKRLVAISLSMVLMVWLCFTASADVIQGLQDAKTELLTGIKTVLDTVIVPLLIVVDVLVFLFNLVGFLRSRDDGGNHSRQIIGVIITICVGILLGTWYAWGGVMLGTTETSPVTAVRLLRPLRL